MSRQSLAHPTFQRLTQALALTSVKMHWCRNPLNPGTITNLHRWLRRSPARELTRVLDASRPDAVVVNLPTLERGQAVVDAARLITPRPPVWGFIHSPNRPSTIGAKLGVLRDLMVPRLVRRFDHLLVVCATGAQKISSRYHVPLPQILYPPVEPPEPVGSGPERSARRSAAGLPDRFLLGIVGRVHPDKGVEVAVRITAKLRAAGYPVDLAVVGDGPGCAAARRLAHKLEISGNVCFLGWRDDADELIPLFDAVIMPSKHEGMPLTALQAARAQVPVIGYAVDGLTELLPPGFAIPYGDQGALAHAVAALLSGAVAWPATEMALRAKLWSDPANAAERLLTLLQAAAATPAP